MDMFLARDAKSEARPAIKRRIVEGGICALPLIAEAPPATRRDSCPFVARCAHWGIWLVHPVAPEWGHVCDKRTARALRGAGI